MLDFALDLVEANIGIYIMGYLYILKLNDGSYYIGSCRDIVKRLSNHEHKQVFSTKHKLPFVVMYTKKFATNNEARKEELRVKRWKKRKSIENLCNFDNTNIAKRFTAFVADPR